VTNPKRSLQATLGKQTLIRTVHEETRNAFLRQFAFFVRLVYFDTIEQPKR
jgi:hypothetical protein